MDRIIKFAAVVLLLVLNQAAMAVHLGANSAGDLLPWSQQMSHPLDEPVNKALNNKAFLMNLGPTGIRADIRKEYAKAFKVKFVFQDDKSPAKGLIKPGDMIIGAGGEEFKNPHKFHRKNGGRGWPGPPFELAHAIEDAQVSDGKLTLIVLEGGDKSKRKNVTIQLEPKGRFAPTWPWNCPRSDKLLKDLVDFVFEDGIPRKGRHHKAQLILALWASGDERAIPVVKSYAKALMQERANYKSTGMCTWMWGYNGIFLGEYYNMTKDKGVMPAVEALNKAYEYGQNDDGSYTHRPRLAFLKMTKSPYASMAAAGGVCMLAQSIFRAAGLPYNENAYRETHLGYLRTVSRNSTGSVGYGFEDKIPSKKKTDNAILRLADKSKVKEPAPRPYYPELGGKGLPIEGGLKSIGEYTVEWPTKADFRWKNGCLDWLKTDADKVTLRWQDEGLVVANRPLPEPVFKEPTGPFNTKPGGVGHQAAPGMGALAHFIGNKGNKPWNWLGKHMATGCALTPHALWDGHADAIMHAFFGSLAAARADEKDFRTWADYTKTWIILSETHDGKGLVDQPFGCQRNATCSIPRGRRSYTHVAITILSLPKRKLLLTGADYAQPAGPTTTRAHASSSYGSSNTPAPSPQPLLRDARTLSAKNREILDRSLLRVLVKLSDSNRLKPTPMRISITTKTVALVKAEDDGTLTFKTTGGQTAGIAWNKLGGVDRANLSILMATLKPESTDAKAMVAVYMESLGRVDQADKYFAEAGEESKKKLEKLFD